LSTGVRAPVSAVLVTRNAAAQLGACLESAAFADDIVVVDSGSEDATCEIAERHGARVVHKEWMGFGRQKQFAVEQARHDWVLCLDSDERVSAPLAASIVGALAAPVAPVYRMARRNRFLGKWLSHGEGYPDWSPRLFDRREARWSDDPVHEKVLFLKFYLLRLGFLDGLPGLVHISIGCMNSYLKYAKIIELQNARRRA
jgi:glycosyltransferase involved in cell wall biosynthesis